MRSAIGNSLLTSLVVVIVSLIVLVFVNILSYSKAYRVKNGIIEIIERQGEYSDSAKDEIKNYLHQVGYQIGNCHLNDEINKNNGYKYCVLEIKASDGGKYYKVTTYVEYNFPIVNQILTTPVSGETKILGKTFN